jgi:hypothetical protein
VIYTRLRTILRGYSRKKRAYVFLGLTFFCINSSYGQIGLSIDPITLAKFTASGAVSYLATKKAFETACDYLTLKGAVKQYKQAYASSDISYLHRAASLNVHANLSGAMSILSGLVAVKALLYAKSCVT